MNGAPWWLKLVFSLYPAVRHAPETCKGGVYVATKEDSKSTNGQFFDEKGSIIPMRGNFDKAVGERLWLLTEQLLSRGGS